MDKEKHFLKKKGITPITMISSLVIAIVTLLFLFKITQTQVEAMDNAFLREACKQSVQRQSELHIKTYNPPSEMINCPTSYLDFTRDKINYEYGDRKKSTKLKGSDEDRKETMKKAMADEIYYCWNQFGEGKLDLFGGPKKYCSVCSVLTFKDQGTELNGYEFYSYLMKTYVPDKELAREGITYFDYMQGYQKKGAFDPNILLKNKQELEQTKMETNSAYAVVFVYAKSEPMIDNALEIIGKFWESNSGKVAVIGAALLFVGGAVVSLTGIGAPAGVAMMVTAGAMVVRSVTMDAAIEGATEAYVKRDVIRDWTSFTMFGKYDENILKDLGCEELAAGNK